MVMTFRSSRVHASSFTHEIKRNDSNYICLSNDNILRYFNFLQHLRVFIVLVISVLKTIIRTQLIGGL